MNDILMAFRQLEISDRDWLRAIENRKTGSSWGEFMPWQRLAGWPWQKLDESDRTEGLHSSECDYYYVSGCLPPGATENIKLLPEFDCFDSIVVLEADHGVELVSLDIMPQPTDTAWLILGPDRTQPDKRTVWTAYPGRYAVSAAKHPAWNGTREALHYMVESGWPIAVKGINDPILRDRIMSGFKLSCLTGRDSIKSTN